MGRDRLWCELVAVAPVLRWQIPGTYQYIPARWCCEDGRELRPRIWPQSLSSGRAGLLILQLLEVSRALLWAPHNLDVLLESAISSIPSISIRWNFSQFTLVAIRRSITPVTLSSLVSSFLATSTIVELTSAFSRNLLCNDTVDELNKREIIRGFRSRIIIVNYFCGGCSW